MHNINWDDFRYVLAVCDAGSLSGAARALNVNHATVLRRINTFEEQLGKTIFIRTPSGYSYDPNAGTIIDTLKEMQVSAEKLQNTLFNRSSSIGGLVRLTSTDSMCQTILPDIINQIQKEFKDIRIELSATNLHLNMYEPNADISIRPANSAPKGVMSKKIAKVWFKIYALQSFWNKYNDVPYQELQWYGLTSLLGRSTVAKWMSENIPEDSVKLRTDSFIVLSELLKIGNGVSFLPTILESHAKELVTNPRLDLVLSSDVWICSHVELVKNPHIRVCVEMISNILSKKMGDVTS